MSLSLSLSLSISPTVALGPCAPQRDFALAIGLEPDFRCVDQFIVIRACGRAGQSSSDLFVLVRLTWLPTWLPFRLSANHSQRMSSTRSSAPRPVATVPSTSPATDMLRLDTVEIVAFLRIPGHASAAAMIPRASIVQFGAPHLALSGPPVNMARQATIREKRPKRSNNRVIASECRSLHLPFHRSSERRRAGLAVLRQGVKVSLTLTGPNSVAQHDPRSHPVRHSLGGAQY